MREEQPDPDLNAELDRLAGPGWRRIAAASIDLGSGTPTRLAVLGTHAHGYFEIGSVTKALTGMLLAVSVQRDELGLDSTVGDLAPGLRNTEVAQVAMRELCTHRSGLPRLPRDSRTFARAALFALAGADPYRGTTAARVISLAGRQPLIGRGGYRYSNLGAALTGQLLALSSGGDFAVLLAERVLKPLGMHSSTVATPRTRAAHGWSARGMPRAPWIPDGYAPAGGVIATIGDMARLAEGLLRGDAPGADSMRALPHAAGREASRHSGMFWCIDPAPEGELVWHNGATGGYSAFLALRPNAHRAVVVLADKAQPGQLQEIAMKLLKGTR